MNRFIAASLASFIAIWPITAKGYGIPVSISLSNHCLTSISGVQQEIVNYISTDKGLKSKNWRIPSFMSEEEVNLYRENNGFLPLVRLSMYDITDQYFVGSSQKLHQLHINYHSAQEGVISGRGHAIHNSPIYKKKLSKTILDSCPQLNQILFTMVRTTGTEDVYGRDLNSNSVYRFKLVSPQCGRGYSAPTKLKWGEAFGDC